MPARCKEESADPSESIANADEQHIAQPAGAVGPSLGLAVRFDDNANERIPFDPENSVKHVDLIRKSGSHHTTHDASLQTKTKFAVSSGARSPAELRLIIESQTREKITQHSA